MAACLCLVLFVTCYQFALRYPRGPLSTFLAGLAGAFLIGELMSVGLMVVRIRDEFQRVLLTRSFLWATVITMGVSMVWGFAELHARGAVPHVPLVFIPFILIFVTMGAKVLIFRQHRSPSE